MDYALEKELIFGQPRCMFLHVRNLGDTERIIGTWFKKGREEEKRWFSLLK
jgi:hypothetical protein